MKLREFLRSASFRRVPYLSNISASYEHIPSLDGLRAVSIIAVLLTHFAIPDGPGGYGVFLFFIVSGFLITRLMFAEKYSESLSLKNFYVRRLFRLYPVLLVFCVVSILMGYIFYGSVSADEAAGALLYYSNFLLVYKELNGIPWKMDVFQVFWSLSIEEHFYIVFPLVFIFLSDAKKIVAISLVVIIGCAIGRYVMANAHPELIETHYFGMLTQYRVDSIVFGVLLAAMCEIPAGQRIVLRADRYVILFFAFSIMVAGFVFLRDPVLKTALRWPLLGFPLLVMISAIVFSPKHRLLIAILNHPAAVWTGKLSYSLYVWHMLAGYAAFTLFPKAIAAVVAIVLSYVFAAGSYHLIEQPMIRVRKRMRPVGPKSATDVIANSASASASK